MITRNSHKRLVRALFTLRRLINVCVRDSRPGIKRVNLAAITSHCFVKRPVSVDSTSATHSRQHVADTSY